MIAPMEPITMIKFFDGRDEIVHMTQSKQESGQYVFTLFDPKGKRLGQMDPDLTYSHGYAQAIKYVARELLPQYPNLRVTIRAASPAKATNHVWSNDDIRAQLSTANLKAVH